MQINFKLIKYYIFLLPTELELPPDQPPATHITASNFSGPKTESSSFKMSDSLKKRKWINFTEYIMDNLKILFF